MTVLDPFSGTGTTCLVAKQLGRQYIGIELSQKYCDISKKRIANCPEKLATFLNPLEAAIVK
jgi:DNA modification methylase